MGNNLGNALDLRKLVIGLLQKRIVLDCDDIAVAQRIGVDARKQRRVVLLVNKILQCLLPRDKDRGADVGDEVDLRADGFGLGLGIVLVNVDKHLILALEFLNHCAGIIKDEAERAHDNEARHRHADGREGHEAVQEHAPEALAQ